jgi:hypothetical protein
MIMKKIIILSLMAAVASLAYAQTFEFLFTKSTRYAVNEVTNDDISGSSGDLLFLIKYIGDQDSGIVDLDTGNLELLDGDLSSETVDTQIQTIADTYNAACGVALGVDLGANAACDTYGEVVDIVNASDDWRMVLVQALRADTWEAAGAEITDPADAQAKLPGGLAVYSDTSDNTYITAVVWPHYDRTTMTDIEPFLGAGGIDGAGGARTKNEDLLDGVRTWLLGFEVRDSDGNNDDGVVTFYSIEQSGDYTATTLGTYAVAADDTWYWVDVLTAGQLPPAPTKPGELLVARLLTTNMDTGDNNLRILAAFEDVKN